jgi:cyclopropane fatty-acyl-phospholipid synthase-like methyltransferase
MVPLIFCIKIKKGKVDVRIKPFLMFYFHPEIAVFNLRSVARLKSETSFFIVNVEQTRKHYLIGNVLKGKSSLNVFIFIL